MKKLMIALLALTLVFALAACGSSGGNKDGAAAAATTTATGAVVTAEIPENWKFVSGDKDDSMVFDFIYTSDALDADYFSVFRDTQDMEHYKEMIATGNYGQDLGDVELGEGTWRIAEKVAAGPIGDNTCVIQAYGCDLSSAEVQAVLASLKWAE